ARLRSGIMVWNRRAGRHPGPHRRSAEPGYCRGDEVAGRYRAVDLRGGDSGRQLAGRVFRLYQERVCAHRQGGQGVRCEVRIEIDLAIASVQILSPQVRAGKLRALAVTGEKRSRTVPDVPALAEQGFNGFSVLAWGAAFGPAGVGKPIR